jgi:hypothetical protein
MSATPVIDRREGPAKTFGGGGAVLSFSHADLLSVIVMYKFQVVLTREFSTAAFAPQSLRTQSERVPCYSVLAHWFPKVQ